MIRVPVRAATLEDPRRRVPPLGTIAKVTDAAPPTEPQDRPGAEDARSASDRDLAELLDAARLARANAHVPYSGFAMGAAVRTGRDTVVPGALVENVSLGLAMCAERVAMFAAATSGDRPVQLALISRRTAGTLTFPCGACLQVALELGGPEVEVIVSDPDGVTETARVGDLLPSGPRLHR